MPTVKLTITDEVWCTFVGFKSEHHDFLYQKYGILVEGARWLPSVKLRRWDGKTRFYDITGRTYVALLEEIIPIVVSWGYEIDIEDKREYHEGPTDAHIEEVFVEFAELGVVLRDYQKDAVRDMVHAGNGMVIAATGAGKSPVTAAIAATYGKLNLRTLTIVPSSDLVTQTYEWFIKCGLNAGEYSGAVKNKTAQHIVATWQSLQNHPELVSGISLNNDFVLDYNSTDESTSNKQSGCVKGFACMVIDECHQGTAAVLQSLIADHGKNIPFKFGVTGTLPKPETDQMILRGSIGNVLKEIPASWLIANGYLSSISIEIIQTVEPVDEEFPDYAAEKAYTIRAPERMDFIANLVITKCQEYGNTLVLVNSVPWGKKLAGMIEGAVFLSGDSKKDERRTNYDSFETEDNLIVICTSQIAAVGLSIDRVFCLMLLDPGKSFATTIQSCGRSLRKGRDKQSAHIVDVSPFLKYAKKHQKIRQKWYKEAGYPFGKIVKVRV